MRQRVSPLTLGTSSRYTRAYTCVSLCVHVRRWYIAHSGSQKYSNTHYKSVVRNLILRYIRLIGKIWNRSVNVRVDDTTNICTLHEFLFLYKHSWTLMLFKLFSHWTSCHFYRKYIFRFVSSLTNMKCESINFIRDTRHDINIYKRCSYRCSNTFASNCTCTVHICTYISIYLCVCACLRSRVYTSVTY